MSLRTIALLLPGAALFALSVAVLALMLAPPGGLP